MARHANDLNGMTSVVFRTGCALKVRLDYVVHQPIPDAVVEVYIFSVLTGLTGAWCQMTTVGPDGNGMRVDVGAGAVEFEIDEFSFLPGMYYVNATIVHAGQGPGTAIDYQNQCLTLRVDAGIPRRGTFHMPHRWRPVPTYKAPALHEEMPVR